MLLKSKLFQTAFTFNDILLIPVYSEVLPRDKRTFCKVISQLVGELLVGMGYCVFAYISWQSVLNSLLLFLRFSDHI